MIDGSSWFVNVDCYYGFDVIHMLAKDLLNKLHDSKATHCKVPVEHEATWFLKIGEHYYNFCYI